MLEEITLSFISLSLALAVTTLKERFNLTPRGPSRMWISLPLSAVGTDDAKLLHQQGGHEDAELVLLLGAKLCYILATTASRDASNNVEEFLPKMVLLNLYFFNFFLHIFISLVRAQRAAAKSGQ